MENNFLAKRMHLFRTLCCRIFFLLVRLSMKDLHLLHPRIHGYAKLLILTDESGPTKRNVKIKYMCNNMTS
jgi:hypothetical protein